LKCLQKEPRKRYPSAAELADDLQRFQTNQPIRARRTPFWEKAYKWARRRPAVAALLALLALVLVGGFIGMTALWLRAEADSKAARAAEREAVKSEQRALDAEKEANTSAQQAVTAMHAAEKAGEQARTNFQKSRRLQYASGMLLAQNALMEGR